MNDNIIKHRAITSTIWKFLERLLAQLVSMTVSIILARLLMPEDYSVVSAVTIFFTFANVIIAGGLNSALIQKKDAGVEDYSSVLYFSLFISFLVYLLLFFIAPLIAQWFHKVELVRIVRVMGLILPINAYKSIICAYISSHLQFRKFFFATLGGTLFSALVGIYMAIKGFGAWALVAQQMTNTTMDTLILHITTKMPLCFNISILRLKALISYGWKVLVSSLISTIYTQINPLVIGTRYTGADLSFYTKGSSFPAIIASTSNYTLSAVLFPVMSKYQDDREALLRYTRRFIKLSSFIMFPLLLGFFAVADNFVGILLTDKWLPAVPFMKLFCIAYMFEMIHTGNCETIKAMGRSDLFLKMEIIKKTCYFITIAVFVRYSKTPLELALSSIVCTIIAVIVNCIPNIRLLGYSVRDQFSDILLNLICAIIMCIVVVLVGQLKINKILLLFFQITIGVFTYIILNIITRNDNLRYSSNIIKLYLNKEI